VLVVRVCCSITFLFSTAIHSLEKTTTFKVLFDDDIRDSVEHNLDVLCVCGTGHVGVDLLHTLLHVEVLKLCLDVGAGVVVCVRTCRKMV
jgi:hypothetical protein